MPLPPDKPAISYRLGEPQAHYDHWQATLAPALEALLVVEFELDPYWQEGAAPLSLTALYCLQDGHLQAAVTDRSLSVGVGKVGAVEQFHAWVDEFGLACATVDAPLELLPRSVSKPWGQEIWYTGAEQRGVCHFASSDGSTPIPWLQAILPGAAAGLAGQPLLLLKILDPVPQPVTGDLYFELHEHKREVYVVTQVDKRAWPDGVGYIRYGFELGQIQRDDNHESFRARYLAAVQAYESVRRSLDELPDGELPDPAQLALERELREDMNSFTHLRPLRAGDVVVVPRLLPHALQHGVRTVEFQTPVYERKILSFAQKVVTQDHWDTASAIDQMVLTEGGGQSFEVLEQGGGLLIERIVDFPDFEVWRIRLEAGSTFAPGAMKDYGVLMVIDGEMALAGRTYEVEQALLLPRHWQGTLIPANPAQPLVLLLALPRI
jgi:hypothetical protein